MNGNIKWIEDNNKVNKLKKLGISGVDDKVKDVKSSLDEKEKLEKEKKQLSEKYTEVLQKIADLELEAKKVEMEKEEFETATTATGSNTHVAGKGGKDKTTAFKAAYNYAGDLENWHKDLLAKKQDNLYEMYWEGKKYRTNEELGAMRIAFEVCWQIAQATDFNAKVDANNSSYLNDATIKNDLKTAFATLKAYAANMNDVGDDGEKGGVPVTKHNGSERVRVHEYKDKQFNFNFKVFFNFMEKLAPLDQINGGSQKHLIDELSGPWTGKKWFIWEVGENPLSQEERELYVKSGNVPKVWKNKDFVAYWEDTSKGKPIEIKSGLRGFIELYHAIFSNRGNREKLSLVRDGVSMYNSSITVGSTITAVPKDSNLRQVLDLGDSTFQNNYSYLSDVVEDENGNSQRIWCIYDTDDRIRHLNSRKQLLGIQAKSLAENDLGNQNKLIEEKKSKIREEESKIEVKDKEVQDLVDELVKAKQKKVEDMNIVSWGDTQWSESKNILKAAAIKKTLLDIKWLENDGNDNRPFKNPANQTVWNAIESKRQILSTWNAVIKQYFESKGSDLASRIAACKSDTEIGLEIVRDAFQDLGNHQTEVDAIQAELDKDKPQTPPPSDSKIKIDELQNLLHAKKDATESDLKLTEWENVLKRSGSTINSKDKIKELIAKTGYDKKGSTNAAEKKRFKDWEEHLKGHAYGEAKATKDSGEEQWNEFIKKDPKVIIGAILYFDFEQSGDTTKNEIKAKMKKAKEDKEKEDKVESVEDSWDPENQKDMTRYLYRTAVGKSLFDNVKMKTDDKTPEPKDKEDDGTKKEHSWFKFGSGNVWRPMVTYGLILAAIVGVAAAIFWKNIVDWWNGPAEEAGGIDEEGSDEDEEKE